MELVVIPLLDTLVNHRRTTSLFSSVSSYRFFEAKHKHRSNSVPDAETLKGNKLWFLTDTLPNDVSVFLLLSVFIYPTNLKLI